jgi:hypothetical protein
VPYAFYIDMSARKILSEDKDEDKFRGVRWLKGEEAEVEPARCSLERRTHYKKKEEEGANDDIERHYESRLSEEAQIKKRDENEERERDPHPHKLPREKSARLSERIHGDKAGSDQGEHPEKDRPIEIYFSETPEH